MLSFDTRRPAPRSSFFFFKTGGFLIADDISGGVCCRKEGSRDGSSDVAHPRPRNVVAKGRLVKRHLGKIGPNGRDSSSRFHMLDDRIPQQPCSCIRNDVACGAPFSNFWGCEQTRYRGAPLPLSCSFIQIIPQARFLNHSVTPLSSYFPAFRYPICKVCDYSHLQAPASLA